jgi:hypothetical protein
MAIQFNFWKQGVFMRNLNSRELECVSGGDWSIGFDAGVVEGEISGEETIQDIAASVANGASDAYWYARDAMADFYEAIANYYASVCGG